MQSSIMLKSHKTLPCMERRGCLFTSYAAPPLQVLTREYFEQCNLRIQRSEHQCKFTQRPMYEITLAMPNDLDIHRLYSVPCGQRPNNESCQSWIFLCVPTEGYDSDGECLDASSWIHSELDRLGWGRICAPKQERFVCSKCRI